MFVNRNMFGKWEKKFITKEEENKVRDVALRDNLRLMDMLKNPIPRVDEICLTLTDSEKMEVKGIIRTLEESERIAIFNNISKHYHFRAEDYVDWKIETHQRFKKPVEPKKEK